ncbi:conserved hypothetical protein [Ricinus communis]|uniref:Uncharacterized protein n=1 Tax=Ricinus communis TaxID=3988 RepID=B9T0F5_RICCO|nr:conserved hypothetical protein [Ricinus communis]
MLAGKEILFKIVTKSLLAFVMSVFKLLVRMLKGVERLIASLWWNGEKEGRKLH